MIAARAQKAKEPESPFPETSWAIGRARSEDSNLVFYAYLVLVAFQYTGLPDQIPLLKATRVMTLLGYGLFAVAIARGGLSCFKERQTQILAAILAWTMLSVLWAYVQMNAFNQIRPLFDYFTFMVVTAYVLDRPQRFDGLSAVLGLSAVIVVARNWGHLGQSQRVGGFRAPYFLGDGNDFAWGMNVVAPMILALAIGNRRLLTRLAALAAVAVCLLGMIGTQSRGGTLGLAAAVLYGWLFVARRKVLGALGVAAVVIGVAVVAPGSYFSRMETIANYEEDNSAQARLQAWGAAFRMAITHPLGVGAGNFNSAYGRWYNPSTFGEGEARVGWGGARWISAHSVFFKVLGEYGFGGFALLVWLICANIMSNHRSREALKAAPRGAPMDDRWPALLSMSVVAFAVSGIFLGGLNYPHMYLLSAATIALGRMVTLEQGTALQSARSAAPVPARQFIARPSGTSQRLMLDRKPR